ncbi:hypothetical protein BDN71DRAFT_554169 [Pleurotus eryngii]|uniref:Uncharacterized protein n=1 Tax=Pleurotus eryngii TaxID=5323 RepID=A0A9P6DHL6_PLEER|nr:hypothetical protein BDN71DRAFT_554169 [Pleurotus eryngii]
MNFGSGLSKWSCKCTKTGSGLLRTVKMYEKCVETEPRRYGRGTSRPISSSPCITPFITAQVSGSACLSSSFNHSIPAFHAFCFSTIFPKAFQNDIAYSGKRSVPSLYRGSTIELAPFSHAFPVCSSSLCSVFLEGTGRSIRQRIPIKGKSLLNHAEAFSVPMISC